MPHDSMPLALAIEDSDEKLADPQQQKGRSGLLAAFRATKREVVSAVKRAGTGAILLAMIAAGASLLAPQTMEAQASFQIFTYTGEPFNNVSPAPPRCPAPFGNLTATVIYSNDVISGQLSAGPASNLGPTQITEFSVYNGQVSLAAIGRGGPQGGVSTDWDAGPQGDIASFSSNGSNCEFYTYPVGGSWSSVPVFQTQAPQTLGAPQRLPNPNGETPSVPNPTTPISADANGDSCASHGTDPTPNAMCGNPINAATGNKFQTETDFVGGPNTHISFTRYYNSQDSSAGSLGAGWHSTYHRSLIVTVAAVVSTRADGGQELFFSSGGVWTADLPDTTSVLAPVMSNGMQTGWTLTLNDDTVENYTLNGQLTSIVTRAGLATTLSYNISGQLQTVTGPFGHQLFFTYDSQGRVQTMTAPGSNSGTGLYTYGYGANDTLTSVQYPDTTVRQYVYENASFPTALTGIIDENTNRYATWGYDTQFRATSSQHAGGADLTTVTYNPDGSSTITDANSNARTLALVTQFTTPKPSGVTGVPNQSAGGQSFTYDPNTGFVTGVTDFNGNLTAYTHNANGEQLTRVLASGTSLAETISTTWLSNFHLPHIITEPNRTTTFNYDSQGDVLTRVITAGTATHTWTFTYYLNGQLKTAQDPDLNTTTYTYDAQGDLASIKDALNHTVNITSYDPTGRPLSITDVNGVVTTLVYDQRQRLLTSTVHTTGGNLTTSYGYDLAGNLTKITQPDNSYLVFTYDPAHRLTKITDALGNYTVLTPDPANNITQVQVFDATNTLRQTRSYVYDTTERLYQEIGAAGQTTTYGYDPQSNLTGITPPAPSGAVTMTYDQLNRLATRADPAPGGTTTFGYNANDVLTSVQDANGNTTAYTPDGFGRVTGIVSPDSGATTFQYDAADNLTQRVQAGSLTMNATYDALNRVKTVKYTGDTTLNVTNNYDQTGHGFGIGRLTSATDQVGSLSLTYDERGNITNELRTPTGLTALNTSTTYDAAGNVSSITYPSGNVVSNVRDSMGKVTSVTSKPSGASSTSNIVSGVTYEPLPEFAAQGAPPVTGLTFGNNVTGMYGYDQDYRATTRVDTGTAVVQNLAYAYFANDSVQTITDAVNAANTQNMTYDTLDRLKTGGYGTYGFTWDPVSNIKTQVINGTTTSYGYTTGTNRLSKFVTGSTTDTVVTSASGNITGIKIGTTAVEMFAYNKANELATATTASNTASYAFDEFGKRLKEVGTATGTSTFQYDDSEGLGPGANLLTDTDGAGNSRVDYIYLNGTPISSYQPSNNKFYFISTDRLGTPSIVTDGTQANVWSATYQPFGFTSTGASGIVQNLRLPGQEWDLESTLNHNGFRDYATTLTRYVQTDKIGLAGGMNTYQALNGNAFKYVDRKGTLSIVEWLAYKGAEHEIDQFKEHYENAAVNDVARLFTDNAITLACINGAADGAIGSWQPGSFTSMAGKAVTNALSGCVKGRDSMTNQLLLGQQVGKFCYPLSPSIDRIWTGWTGGYSLPAPNYSLPEPR